MRKSLGDRISILRREANMTKQQLAEKIGVSRSELIKIENSQRAVSIEEGDAISKVLGISINTLIDINNKQDEKTFVMTFKEKGMPSNKIEEIARCEMLFDTFITQEEIYRGK